MKKYGFYCRMFGKDCFYETNQTRRTKNLAKDFIISVEFALGKPQFVNDVVIEYAQNDMRKATFELKTIENGNYKGLKYYEINGENFSYGCDSCENPLVECVLIEA